MKKLCKYCKHYDLKKQHRIPNRGFWAMCSLHCKEVRITGICNDYIENEDLKTYRCQQKQYIDFNNTSKYKMQYDFELDGFKNQDDAKKDYLVAYQVAEARAKEIIKSLKHLMKTLNFDISYILEGDTYGIDVDYQYIEIIENRYNFHFLLDI